MAFPRECDEFRVTGLAKTLKRGRERKANGKMAMPRRDLSDSFGDINHVSCIVLRIDYPAALNQPVPRVCCVHFERSAMCSFFPIFNSLPVSNVSCYDRYLRFY